MLIAKILRLNLNVELMILFSAQIKIYNEYREVFRTESAMETTEGIFALFE